MHTENPTSEIMETWMKIIRKIGGKRIKITMASDVEENMSEDGNFINSRYPTVDSFDNAILLKNFDVGFYTYKIKNRHKIFSAKIDSIERIFFKEFSPEKYRLSLVECEGMCWVFEIELV